MPDAWGIEFTLAAAEVPCLCTLEGTLTLRPIGDEQAVFDGRWMTSKEGDTRLWLCTRTLEPVVEGQETALSEVPIGWIAEPELLRGEVRRAAGSTESVWGPRLLGRYPGPHVPSSITMGAGDSLDVVVPVGIRGLERIQDDGNMHCVPIALFDTAAKSYSVHVELRVGSKVVSVSKASVVTTQPGGLDAEECSKIRDLIDDAGRGRILFGILALAGPSAGAGSMVWDCVEPLGALLPAGSAIHEVWRISMLEANIAWIDGRTAAFESKDVPVTASKSELNEKLAGCSAELDSLATVAALQPRRAAIDMQAIESLGKALE